MKGNDPFVLVPFVVIIWARTVGTDCNSCYEIHIYIYSERFAGSLHLLSIVLLSLLRLSKAICFSEKQDKRLNVPGGKSGSSLTLVTNSEFLGSENVSRCGTSAKCGRKYESWRIQVSCQ